MNKSHEIKTSSFTSAGFIKPSNSKHQTRIHQTLNSSSLTCISHSLPLIIFLPELILLSIKTSHKIIAMKQKIQLIAFLLFCGAFITTALYAGRNSFEHCDKCHFYSDKNNLAQQ